MIYIGTLLLTVSILALWSDTYPVYIVPHTMKNRQNAFAVSDWLMLLILTLFAGMRNVYNDTENYIRHFRNSVNVFELHADDLDIARNPLYVIMVAIVKTVTDNYHVLFLLCAFFVNYSVMKFLKRYSVYYALSIYIYVASGLFVIGIAAQKQILSMAVLLWSIPCMEEKKYFKFLCTVFVASLFHFYAICFVVILLIQGKPWNKRQKILLAVCCMGGMFFNQMIDMFLNIIGVFISRESRYIGVEMNPVRVVFHMALPIVIMIYANKIYKGKDHNQRIFAGAAVLTSCILILALNGLANEVGRFSRYFELVAIPAWSYIVDKMSNAANRLAAITCVLGYYLVFFYYAYAINTPFMNIWK